MCPISIIVNEGAQHALEFRATLISLFYFEVISYQAAAAIPK